MDSPIVHDSGPFTKLDLMATVLPQKLPALCQAAVKKAMGLFAAVTAYQQDRDQLEDDTDDWCLDGHKTMTIPSSLCPQEVNIVQLICLLGSALPMVSSAHYIRTHLIRFPETNIYRMSMSIS